MAERSFDKKARSSQPVASQLNRSAQRPSSSSKVERPKKIDVRSVKSATNPMRKHTDDLFAKEEHYRLLNKQLEAKTADILQQSEQIIRQRNEILLKPTNSLVLTDFEDEDNSRVEPAEFTPLDCSVKVRGDSNEASSPQSNEEFDPMPQTPEDANEDHAAAAEESAGSFLAKAIHSMEENVNGTVNIENNAMPEAGDFTESGISEAQIRVLRTRLRIMQEELDQVSSEFYKKDEENAQLNSKIKEIEEDRAKLRKMANAQRAQIEKHKALAHQSEQKCDFLQSQVSALTKEIEDLKRSHKQSAALHSSTDVRLNRALEEVEKLKAQLNGMKQINKDALSKEHQSKENLLAENKILQKQKEELILNIKKQLKLIDVYKRQKMHYEAAKLLSFAEDEFMKALDWGKS